MPPPDLNGALPEPDFAAWVEELGRSPEGAAPLLDLLQEPHPVYQERSTQAIVRMRGWLLVTLARGVLPAAALPFVLEELDTSLHPYLVAAAARALRSHPEPNATFGPFLLRALKNIRSHDEPISFARYADYEPTGECTGAVTEILRSLVWLGGAGRALAPELKALRENPGWSESHRELLQAGLASILEPEAGAGGDAACCQALGALGRCSWLPAARPSSEVINAIVFEDQSGAKLTYREFFHGQPAIVAFFYTRCDNPLKCSLTIWKLARVQKLLQERGQAEAIRTAAITYDPAYDLPERLRIHGRNRQLRMDAGHRLLRAVAGLAPLRDYFGLGVSFVGSLVNRHRIEIFLLDRSGRIAASFQRLHWQESEVVDQAVALLTESPRRATEPSPNQPLPLSGPVAAVLLALLPKCPICWAAYLSAFGLAPLAAGVSRGFQIAAGGLLAINLACVFWRARVTQRWLGFGLAAAGSAGIGAAYWLEFRQFAPLGVILLCAGAIYGAWGGGIRKRLTPWLPPPA